MISLARRYFNLYLNISLLVTILPMPRALADDTIGFNLKGLALPSELQNIPKSSGAIYYSPSVKGKALIPVHCWGEVEKPGLHFIPVDTTFISGLSLAGGARGSANLENVKVSRFSDKEIKSYVFNLETGGDAEAFNFALKPGDTIFIEKSHFYENRAYYTSLIAVASTILSSIILYQQIQKNR
jgi:hypothetical protein